MKKVLFMCILAAVSVACSMPTKLVNTATYKKVNVNPIFADLDVSPTKITYFLIPSSTVVNGGYDNIVNTAVREALIANGNADVLVGMETQVKYDKNGAVESMTVTGYPAKYVNFRSPGEEDIRNLNIETKSNSVLPILDKLKKK